MEVRFLKLRSLAICFMNSSPQYKGGQQLQGKKVLPLTPNLGRVWSQPLGWSRTLGTRGNQDNPHPVTPPSAHQTHAGLIQTKSIFCLPISLTAQAFGISLPENKPPSKTTRGGFGLRAPPLYVPSTLTPRTGTLTMPTFRSEETKIREAE